MMEGTQDGNLPSGVAVNNTYIQPTKSGRITVCLQNTNDHNAWIRQPLYAGDLWDMDKEDWEYEPVLVKDAETNSITVKISRGATGTSTQRNFLPSCGNVRIQ